MNILVIGATGKTGLQILGQALARGHDVTALVRNPANLKVKGDRLTVMRGNVLDPTSLGQAMKGQDAVLCALGHKRWLGPTSILSKGTENIVQAMKGHGVKRLIAVTALGVGDSRFRLGLTYTLFTIPFILPFYWFDKGRQEKVIRESGLDWTIVRPGVLTNGKTRGVRQQGERVGNYIWPVRIPRADVAAFMLDVLENPSYAQRAVSIC